MSMSMLSQMSGGGATYGMYMGLHWVWWLVWLAIIGVLVWALARGLSGAGRETRSPPHTDSAEDVLRARFDRGEISEEEFRKSEKVLRES